MFKVPQPSLSFSGSLHPGMESCVWHPLPAVAGQTHTLEGLTPTVASQQPLLTPRPSSGWGGSGQAEDQRVRSLLHPHPVDAAPVARSLRCVTQVSESVRSELATSPQPPWPPSPASTGYLQDFRVQQPERTSPPPQAALARRSSRSRAFARLRPSKSHCPLRGDTLGLHQSKLI